MTIQSLLHTHTKLHAWFRENKMRITETNLRRIIRNVINESNNFSVYRERGKYIESSDGSLLQLAGMDEPKIIVSNGRERGSLVLHQGGRIYLQTNRMDKFFSTLQELCDYLNQNDFAYDGIDDY